MGAYHTLDLELNRKFTLQKQLWDSVSLERIDMATDVAQNADVAAVVMQEGLAFVCLITSSMTLVRSKIEVTIPRKRKGLVQDHERVISNYLSIKFLTDVRFILKISRFISKINFYGFSFVGIGEVLRIRYAGNFTSY